ncbi:MAG: tetratricopeptide repeat protein, partial [Candidatus Brocadiia bacterium]
MSIKPDLLRARFNLGVVFYQQGKFDEAITQWTELLKIKPDHLDTLNSLATAFYRQGKTDEAIA